MRHDLLDSRKDLPDLQQAEVRFRIDHLVDGIHAAFLHGLPGGEAETKIGSAAFIERGQKPNGYATFSGRSRAAMSGLWKPHSRPRTARHGQALLRVHELRRRLPL